MSKKQPFLIGSLATLLLFGFQNCAKVGVEELNPSSDAGISDVANTPQGDGTSVLPDASGDTPVVKDPTAQDPVVKDPPKQNDPPSKNPPLVSQNPPKGNCDNGDKDKDPGDKDPGHGSKQKDPICLPMSQVHAKQSKQGDMKTVACLSNQSDDCVLICHKPPGNPENTKQLIAHSTGEIQAHLGHGDSLGECPDNKNHHPSDISVCEADGDED